MGPCGLPQKLELVATAWERPVKVMRKGKKACLLQSWQLLIETGC